MPKETYRVNAAVPRLNSRGIFLIPLHHGPASSSATPATEYKELNCVPHTEPNTTNYQLAG
ncbi:hypothetical protein SAMN02745181_0431 [Rubritalea squalenifaciens DSM 18772]|uniref:Uncharacterized protein n=1 Tax=Rubritalea squalenifaciens DSM 18772 TaxID=1123071 RepID=A0A1M6CAC3_9BACT|nr:hypothetical protein SAMN02745181_0431 [Rubritalea squalenifaciens DSM 18772]